MKTLMKTTMAAFFAVSLSSCVLVEGMDAIQTPGTIPVAEVGQGIFAKASSAWLLGTEMFSNSKFTAEQGKFQADRDTAFATAVWVGRSAVNKQEWSGYYFKSHTVDRCLDHVFNSVLGLTLVYFDGKAGTASKAEDAVIDPMVVTSRASCDNILVRTGYLINAGEAQGFPGGLL
ncbi:MAG: hypothetical protein HS115_00480 [Spirochaetales bacterium]|nr:hypothetical protein [Spirochaetales bacterium]